MTKGSRHLDPALLKRLVPRMTRYIPHRPTPNQSAFLLVPGLEALYGGAAGGGKSDALLMAALQYVDVARYAAVVVRENYQMLAQPGGLMQRAGEWLGPTDAAWSAADHQWRFPSGATLTFRHLQDDGAERNFQGAEYHFIGVDEVTDFSEDKYRFLFSRLRRGHDASIPLRMRSASNPYGPGLEWCRRRFILEGRKRGRVFIPARLEDNPYLDREAYEASLKELGPVVYRQLRYGDWTVRAEIGLFRSEWFAERAMSREDLPREKIRMCRFWDLAATEAGRASDPDYTAGVLLGRSEDGRWFVIDVRRARSSPLAVEQLIRSTAEEDRIWAKEAKLPEPSIRIEQEPGSSGASVVDYYLRTVLPSFDVRGVRATGSKETRVAPVAARAEAGHLWIARGSWNTEFLDEVVAFPSAAHDDQVDALAGAFEALAAHRFDPIVALPFSIDKEWSWRDMGSWT